MFEKIYTVKYLYLVKNFFNKTLADSPRIWLTVSKLREVMKVVINAFSRNVTFWYGLVGSSRLGTSGSRSDIKSISERDE